jgi:hypothetical protein
MVDTTLSTKNTTINREENKNNGRHYIEHPLFLFSSRFIVVLLVLNVVSTIVFIFLTIYSGVVGTQCSAHHCFYFPHGHYIEHQQHHYKS